MVTITYKSVCPSTYGTFVLRTVPENKVGQAIAELKEEGVWQIWVDDVPIGKGY